MSNQRNLLGVLLIMVLTTLGQVAMADNYPARFTAFTLQEAENLFLRLLQRAVTKKDHETAEALGFLWQETEDYIELIDNEKVGLGHYTIHKHYANGILMQAPHQFFDRRTGDIATALFHESKVTALALNSISRKAKDYYEQVFDFAHRDDTLYFAFTRAFVAAYPSGTVLQLHGYAQKKRNSMLARSSEIILSLGGPFPDEALRQSAVCLRKTFGKVLTYPDEIGELGGTKNILGRTVRRLAQARFVHIELSAPTRKKLNTSKNQRELFMQCLI